MQLDSGDVFQVVKHAQAAGVLHILPRLNGRIAPGERFFESIQSNLLEYVDLEKLDEVLYNLAPVIHYMADGEHWIPAEFTSDQMFLAVRHLDQMGVFEVLRLRPGLPGEGDRYFEHCQAFLVDRLGVDTLDRLLHVLGQCIGFLASDAAMVNVSIDKGGETCA